MHFDSIVGFFFSGRNWGSGDRFVCSGHAGEQLWCDWSALLGGFASGGPLEPEGSQLLWTNLDGLERLVTHISLCKQFHSDGVHGQLKVSLGACISTLFSILWWSVLTGGFNVYGFYVLFHLFIEQWFSSSSSGQWMELKTLSSTFCFELTASNAMKPTK